MWLPIASAEPYWYMVPEMLVGKTKQNVKNVDLGGKRGSFDPSLLFLFVHSVITFQISSTAFIG